MNVIRKIALWLVSIAAVIAIIGFFLPKTMVIEKTGIINASPETVYALLNDMKTYDSWMTWNQMDPNMKKEYAAHTIGAGAFYSWESADSRVGQGKMSITESTPSKIRCKMEFKGYDEPSINTWEINSSGNGTEVKWRMESTMTNNPFSRWMGLIMGKIVGGEFNKSFNNINQLVEKGALIPSTAPSSPAITDTIPKQVTRSK